VDLGSGTGRLADALEVTHPGQSVLRVDGSAAMLQQQKPSATTLQWDLSRGLPPWPKQPQLLSSSFALHWLPNPVQSLRRGFSLCNRAAGSCSRCPSKAAFPSGTPPPPPLANPALRCPYRWARIDGRHSAGDGPTATTAPFSQTGRFTSFITQTNDRNRCGINNRKPTSTGGLASNFQGMATSPHRQPVCIVLENSASNLEPMTSPSRRIVVCGTDTDVGKTVVSAWLVQGLEASYWKPIQSGLDGGGDRERVRHLLIFPGSGCSLRPLPLASQCRRIGPLSSIKAH
jgi:hypothetical protein